MGSLLAGDNGHLLCLASVWFHYIFLRVQLRLDGVADGGILPTVHTQVMAVWSIIHANVL